MTGKKEITKKLAEKQYKKIVAERNVCVSVFILTHNREKYLRFMVDSLLTQSFSGFVLWILNNSSTDHTEEYLAGIEDDRVIYSNSDVPPFENMRFAKNVCRTEYFIILHDDDILEKSYLEEVLSCMENSSYDELFVGAMLIDSKGNKLSVPCNDENCFDGKESVFCGKQYFEHFFSHTNNRETSVVFPFPAVVYRASFYQGIGEVFTSNAGPAGDQLVHFETERNGGTIGCLAKHLFNYRIHEGQDSQANANIGFMDLMLIDYLFGKKYYKKLLVDNENVLRRKLWFIYRVIVIRAWGNRIDRKQWKSLFSYNCIKRLKYNLPGEILYVKMKLIFYIPHIIRLFYKMIRASKGGEG